MQSSHGANFWRWPDRATERLRGEFPDVEMVELESPSDQPPRATTSVLEDAEAAIAVRLHPKWLLLARHLRWLHCPSAAVHQLLSPELVASSIQVTNGAGVHAASVAEHGLALLLAMLRGIPQALRQQDAHRWDAFALRPELRELSGTTALIVGFGHIGREIGTRLQALGVKVLAIRRRPLPDVGADEVHGLEALERLLARADHVFLTLPATPDTASMLGGRELQLMRPGSHLINLGRGNAMDEAALAATLATGHLHGAALDVTRAEPLAENSPLWNAPRLLLTPHVAAVHPRTWDRQVDCIADKLRRYLAGVSPGPLVDKERGY